MDAVSAWSAVLDTATVLNSIAVRLYRGNLWRRAIIFTALDSLLALLACNLVTYSAHF